MKAKDTTKEHNPIISEAILNCNELKPEGYGEIVIYNPDDSTRLEVLLENETVWLTINQLSSLFGRDRTVIGRHIKNIFSEGELIPSLVCAKFARTGEYGRVKGFRQIKDVVLYNLDVIISVGYRVKSIRGTRFRQWANTVLKEYLIKGYAINPRLEQLERRVSKTEEKLEFFIKTSLPPAQGIFFDGQIYDAYQFICALIKRAKTRLILIDNYIDDTVLTMFDKRSDGVSAVIYTQQVSKQFKLDLLKHNKQYHAINVIIFKKSHDRFLIVDDDVYLVGASLKDLGKKWFGVALMEATNANDLLSRLAE
ncbi:MAG: virulence RhuM family protein [Bacteroidales bacterium]|nr:virulence RhuM family protein [Bacteroidales bacterium]